MRSPGRVLDGRPGRGGSFRPLLAGPRRGWRFRGPAQLYRRDAWPAGRQAATPQPPDAVGPAVSVPPQAVIRSRVPARPSVPPS